MSLVQSITVTKKVLSSAWLFFVGRPCKSQDWMDINTVLLYVLYVICLFSRLPGFSTLKMCHGLGKKCINESTLGKQTVSQGFVFSNGHAQTHQHTILRHKILQLVGLPNFKRLNLSADIVTLYQWGLSHLYFILCNALEALNAGSFEWKVSQYRMVSEKPQDCIEKNVKKRLQGILGN